MYRFICSFYSSRLLWYFSPLKPAWKTSQSEDFCHIVSVPPPCLRYQNVMKAVICWRRCPRPSWSRCCPSLWWRIRRSACWFSPSSHHSSTDATTPPDSPLPGHFSTEITQTQMIRQYWFLWVNWGRNMYSRWLLIDFYWSELAPPYGRDRKSVV